MIMQDFGATMLACTPSYAVYIADTALEMGIDIRDLPLKYGLFGAEPWTNNMRKEIEAKMGIRADGYLRTDRDHCPGVASECEVQDGLHVFDDHFIPEIIDPKTLEVLPPGTPGELVFTSITKEAFPIIRYRTRDLSVLNTDPCPCGRTHVRMGRITGRTDDMLISGSERLPVADRNRAPGNRGYGAALPYSSQQDRFSRSLGSLGRGKRENVL